MVIKATGNVKFADTGTNPVADPNLKADSLDQELQNKAESLIVNLQGALEQLQESSDYYEDLSISDQAKIESMKARIEGQISLLETFIETGEWAGVGSIYEGYNFLDDLASLDSGWNASSNCNYQYLDHDDDKFAEYEDAVMSDPDAGYLAEVIQIPENSAVQSLDPLESLQALGFVIKDEDKVSKVTGKTVGDDIWITIEYEGGETETWVLEGCANRPDVQIYISADQCENGIHMDFSQAIRFGVDSEGNVMENAAGFTLIGGKGNDVIIGSGSYDRIIGWEGEDKLVGLGGDDEIFGGGVMQSSPYSLESTNNIVDGDDIIDGGDGLDTIYGGGGMDTAVIDNNAPFGGDILDEVEYDNDLFFADQVHWNEFSTGSVIDLHGWEYTENTETGEIVVTKLSDSSENEINIQTPDGYTMSYAEGDGNDIVITMAKIDDEDETSYIRIRIKNALATSNQTEITFTTGNESSIVDFSKLQSGGNIISLVSGNGNDTLAGPVSNLDSHGITATDLQNNSTVDLNAILEDKGNIDEETGLSNWGGTTWAIEPDVGEGHIVLKASSDAENLDLKFKTPSGFNPDAVFYVKDGNDMWVYIVDRHDDGSIDLIKIKIVGGGEEGVVNSVVAVGSYTNVPGELMGSTSFDGDDGNDLIFGYTGNTRDWNAEEGDAVLKGTKEYTGEDPDEDGTYGMIDGVPANMVGQQAWYNGNPIEDTDGNPSNWDEDADGDGVNNFQEIQDGTDPLSAEEETPDT